MKAKIVAKETIKASSPTPKTFNLSVLDQVSPPIFTKLYFFYQNSSTDELKNVIAKRTQALKSSLSEVLTRFYPFCGQIRDQLSDSIKDDDGAEFVEACVDCTLSQYLKNPTPEKFQELAPIDFWEVGTCPLLQVQASFFKCGGLAIGMNFSHKVSDASTFTDFIVAWADTANGNYDKVEDPDFSGSQLFPALKEIYLSGVEVGKVIKTNDKTKRFVFTAPRIAALQETALNGTLTRTTRMETITNFLWRVGMKMAMKKAGGSTLSSILMTFINIRKRLPQPICNQTVGNLVHNQIVPNNSGEINLHYLIDLYREQVKETHNAYVNNFDGQQFVERFKAIYEQMMQLMPQLDV